jgi:hypothetical protein
VKPYKVLITLDVLKLPRPSAPERHRLIAFLESLSAGPFQKGDYEETDEIGRPVQIKVIGHYALTFWDDHAVSEVKVARIEKADKR